MLTVFLHFSSDWSGIRYGKREFCRTRRRESLVLLVRRGVIKVLSAERKCRAPVTIMSVLAATCFDFGDKGNYKIYEQRSMKHGPLE